MVVKYWRVSRHKAFELHLGWKEKVDSYFHFWVEWDRKVDCAGLPFSLSLFRFHFGFYFNDVRCWDSKKNCWYPLGEEEEASTTLN